MYVAISYTSAGAEAVLTDIENCREFHVQAPAAMPEKWIEQALAEASGARAIEGGDFLIAVDWVREQAGELTADPAWSGNFSAMLTYARTKGWTDAGGNALRAHVVRSAVSGRQILRTETDR